MEQLKDFSDVRLINGCIYCGGSENTREHVPSKVLLDQPFPENLPIVKACFKCNNSYSHDEEYVACLIECMITGSTDPNKIQNPKIAKILTRHPALRSRIENAKVEAHGEVFFTVEEERFLNVIRKLAMGMLFMNWEKFCTKTNLLYNVGILMQCQKKEKIHGI